MTQPPIDVATPSGGGWHVLVTLGTTQRTLAQISASPAMDNQPLQCNEVDLFDC